jgi:sterol-4alpha-carboxylate 3-dehydrogenase (decarboxylating)
VYAYSQIWTTIKSNGRICGQEQGTNLATHERSSPATSLHQPTCKTKMSTERTRVLVTGGCGFLGTEIVSALLATRRYDITVIDINPPSLGTSTFTQSVRYVRANVLDRDALSKVFLEARPAVVVHTVGVYRLGTARYSMKGKEGEFRINVEGTRNVLDVSRECGAKGLVYTCSVTVVLDELGKDFRDVDEEWPTGRAKTSYGQSKVGSEFTFRHHLRLISKT